jgi:predicted tellurium resistance membrane protein TerC
MNNVLRRHIVFRFFCLAIALQILGVNTGVVYYLNHFFAKEKSISSIKNEQEDEKDSDNIASKKTEKDSQDDFDESYLPHNYQHQPFSTYLQQLIVQYSTSFFFYHASKPSKGYLDIIAPPPRMLV